MGYRNSKVSMFGMVGTMNLQDVLLVASSSVNTHIKRVLLLQTNDLEVVHLSRVIRSFVVRDKKTGLSLIGNFMLESI